MHNKRVGITFGCFDLLHAGHCMMLKEAKQQCDFLIVGLHVDPSIERSTKNKPVQSLYERYIQLEAIKYVDKIIPYQYEKEIIDITKTNNISVRIIGADYINKSFSGKQQCIDNNIEIFYNTRNHDFSTSELRSRIINLETI